MRCIIKKYHESSQVDRTERKWINNNGNCSIPQYLSAYLGRCKLCNWKFQSWKRFRRKWRNGDTPHTYILQTKWTHRVGSLMILMNYNNNGDKWLRAWNWRRKGNLNFKFVDCWHFSESCCDWLPKTRQWMQCTFNTYN